MIGVGARYSAVVIESAITCSLSRTTFDVCQVVFTVLAMLYSKSAMTWVRIVLHVGGDEATFVSIESLSLYL